MLLKLPVGRRTIWRIETSQQEMEGLLKESLVTCFLCGEQLNEFKTLRCMHSFCQACLEELKNSAYLSCPKCTKPTFISGVGDLEQNPLVNEIFRILELAEKSVPSLIKPDASKVEIKSEPLIKKSKIKQEKPKQTEKKEPITKVPQPSVRSKKQKENSGGGCDLCKLRQTTTEVAGYCEDCTILLCSEHLQEHSDNSKLYKNHFISRFDVAAKVPIKKRKSKSTIDSPIAAHILEELDEVVSSEDMKIAEATVQYLLQNGGKANHAKLVQHLKNQSNQFPKKLNLEESLTNILESTVFKKEYNVWMIDPIYMNMTVTDLPKPSIKRKKSNQNPPDTTQEKKQKGGRKRMPMQEIVNYAIANQYEEIQSKSFACQIVFAIVKLGDMATKEEIQSYFEENFKKSIKEKKDWKAKIVATLTAYTSWFDKVKVDGMQCWLIKEDYVK